MIRKRFFEIGRNSFWGGKIKANLKSVMPNSALLLGLFTVTFIFLIQSPLNVLLLNGNSETDSSVFRTIAMQMKEGMMPYRDSFDHKGPLLYIYNYLGVLIRQHRGIWVIEFISAFVTFYFMYKIARLKCDRLQAFLVLVVCIATLYGYFEGGNLTEEYALPFITISLYVFDDYFLNGRISKIRLGICGFGFGAVCMLRINMISVWIVFCCAVLLQSIQMKRMKELSRFLVWFLAGFGSIVLPISCWLFINNAFIDFIKDYFVFNIMYTRESSGVTPLGKYNSFSFFLNNIYVLTAFVIVCCICKEKKLFHRAYLMYEIVTLLMLSMSGVPHPHYGMVLVPIFIYPFSMLMSRENMKQRSWILAFCLYLAVVQVIPTWIGGANKTMGYLLNENKTRERTDTVGKVCAYIKENSDEEDRIIVWGNWNIIYIQGERLPASRYSYQSTIGRVDKMLLTDFFEEINKTMPWMIVIPKGHELGDMGSFIDRNGYICMCDIDGVAIYMQSI